VRFTPETAGTWRWHWRVTTPAGTAVTAPTDLVVTPAAGRGFIRRSAHDARYLAFDDGSPYFAVGENLGWYDARGTYAYDSWLQRLADQRANFARLWMPSWAFGIEWSETSLGDYTERLDRAWQLDHVFKTARRRGIAIELALLNHGAFSTAFNSEWGANPYNAANGGPLTSPAQFFTDATARDYFAQRLRYIVARYGYATNLLAWEFWNEVELTDAYDSAAVTAWHAAMASLVRDLDPHDHLVSTSHAVHFNDPAVWSGGGLDFTQLHFYSRHPTFTWFPNIAQNVVNWSRERVASTGKPVLFAELGINAAGPAETRADDPQGLAVHDGLWAGVVSGGFGTAMSWWWDNVIDVEPDLYYPMFGSVARFVRNVQWDREAFVPTDASVSTDAGRPLVAYGLRGSKTSLLWIKDDMFQAATPQQVEITDAVLHVGSLGQRTWCGRWYDTWAGNAIGRVEIDPKTATLPVPAFTGDVALRLRACDKK
jgi:hypothetical protein